MYHTVYHLYIYMSKTYISWENCIETSTKNIAYDVYDIFSEGFLGQWSLSSYSIE